MKPRDKDWQGREDANGKRTYNPDAPPVETSHDYERGLRKVVCHDCDCEFDADRHRDCPECELPSCISEGPHPIQYTADGELTAPGWPK